MADEEKSLTNISADITIAVVVFLIILALLGAYINDALGLYQQFLNWWYEKDWGSIYRILTIIFTIVNVFLAVFIIFVIRRHAALDKKFPPEGEIVVHTVPLNEEVKNTWQDIRELISSPNASDWNMAVIRADGLLDDVLQRQGYEGETMADRLKIVDPTKLPSLDRVWSAHRLRNTIVHGPMEEHTRETIIHALRSYEQALKELGTLQEKKI